MDKKKSPFKLICLPQHLITELEEYEIMNMAFHDLYRLMVIDFKFAYKVLMNHKTRKVIGFFNPEILASTEDKISNPFCCSIYCRYQSSHFYQFYKGEYLERLLERHEELFQIFKDKEELKSLLSPHYWEAKHVIDLNLCRI